MVKTKGTSFFSMEILLLGTIVLVYVPLPNIISTIYGNVGSNYTARQPFFCC